MIEFQSIRRWTLIMHEILLFWNHVLFARPSLHFLDKRNIRGHWVLSFIVFILIVLNKCLQHLIRLYNCVIRLCRNHNLAIGCKIDMVDKFIKPILLYGCEVWGFHNTYLFEKLHLQFCDSYIELESLNTKLYGKWGTWKIPLNN